MKPRGISNKRGQILIMKGSASCRRFCWLQVNVSYGHEAAASQAPTNGCSWSGLPVRSRARQRTFGLIAKFLTSAVGRVCEGVVPATNGRTPSHHIAATQFLRPTGQVWAQHSENRLPGRQPNWRCRRGYIKRSHCARHVDCYLSNSTVVDDRRLTKGMKTPDKLIQSGSMRLCSAAVVIAVIGRC